MAKLIICCAGRPALNGHKRRTFLWSVEHNCFVHEGRELSETELNAQVEGVFKKNWDLRPFVKVARFSDGAVVEAAVADETKAKIADLQEKLAIARAETHAARVEAKEAKDALAAPSLEAALEIVQRLAPDKLKGKPGRKPVPETMEV